MEENQNQENVENLESLQKDLLNKDISIRYQAAIKLGEMEKELPDVFPTLLKAIKDDNPQFREKSAHVLGKILPNVLAKEDFVLHVSRSLSALLSAMNDKEVAVSYAAISSFKQIGIEQTGSKAIDVFLSLQQIAKAPSSKAQQLAQEMLDNIDDTLKEKILAPTKKTGELTLGRICINFCKILLILLGIGVLLVSACVGILVLIK